MSTKHTPGPWEITGPVGGRAGRRDAVHITARIGQNPATTLATVYRMSEFGGANARLISVAPELAEACRALVGAMGAGAPHARLAEAFYLAKAALAKADREEAVRG